MTLTPKQRLMRGEKISPAESRRFREIRRERGQRAIARAKQKLRLDITEEERQHCLKVIEEWEQIIKENQEPE